MSLIEAPRCSEIGLIAKRPLVDSHEVRNSPFSLYLDRIERPDLKEMITPNEPLVYVTAEFYGRGIKGQGGLGILASDSFETAVKLNLPIIFLTPFYRWERSYELDRSGRQKEIYKAVTPEERGFEKTNIRESISTRVDPVVNLDFYEQKIGNVTLFTPTENNIGGLYENTPESDRRLYQNVAFCFGGYKALKALDVEPSMRQLLNEAPATFFALPRLDDYMSERKMDLQTAIVEARKRTIFTNHTLVPAAEPTITLRQFEHFVMPNIKSDQLNEWLYRKLRGKGDEIKLSTLIFDLSEKKNAVSRIHAREASKAYKDYEGNAVPFEVVTNGIAIERWGGKGVLNIYRKNQVIDKFDLPTENYVANLDIVKEAELVAGKDTAKQELRELLQQRKDQYGNPVVIPEDAKIANWRRRIANYKRPGLIFTHPDIFADILERENIHYIMAGNVHPDDEPMKGKLERILAIINGNEVFKKRVHFIQDYDEELGKALAQGADISINTPIVGKEACGTSGMKDMLNNVIVISTEDGWLADPAIKARTEGQPVPRPSYFQITGKNKEEEVASLYANLRAASHVLNRKTNRSWGELVKEQLKTYLPIISGARMQADYLKLGFPVPAASVPEIIVFAS